MKLFKKPYTLRRYGVKSWEDGFPKSQYTDSTINLDVQPQGDSAIRNGDGQWVTSTMTVYTDSPLNVADPDKGIDADRVLIDGKWYECSKCDKWGNTILSHYVCVLNAVLGETQNDTE